MRRCLVIAILAASTVAARPSSAQSLESALENIPGYTEARAIKRAWDKLDSVMGAVPAILELPYVLSEELQKLRADPLVGPVIDSLIAMYRDRVWTFYGQSAITADSSPMGGLSAGAEVTWDSGLCRLLVASGDAQLYHDDGDTGGALAGTVGGCLPLPGNTLELSYTLERGVRPALINRALLLDERYDSDTFTLGLRFWRFRFTRHQVDVFPLGFVAEILRQDDATGQTIESGQVDVDVAVTRWDRRRRGFLGRDQRWSFVPIRIRSRADAAPADELFFDNNVLTISPVRVESLMLGPVALTSELGSVRGQVTDGEVVVHDAHHLYAEVNIEAGWPDLFGGLEYRHTLEPAPADQFLVEDRVTARGQWATGPSLLAAESYVAASRLLSETDSEAEPTGGGIFRYGHQLSGHLQAAIMVEAARSLLDDQWQYRASASLIGATSATSR